MAIKHVILRGFGFADNTVFIPTRGYTTSLEETVSGAVRLYREKLVTSTLQSEHLVPSSSGNT